MCRSCRHGGDDKRPHGRAFSHQLPVLRSPVLRAGATRRASARQSVGLAFSISTGSQDFVVGCVVRSPRTSGATPNGGARRRLQVESAAMLSPPRFAALFDRDGGDDERNDRVSPGPTEQRVQEQADERRRIGRCRAGSVWSRPRRWPSPVRDRRGVARSTAPASLAATPPPARFRRWSVPRDRAPDQYADRFDGDVGGEREERHRDHPQRDTFPSLWVLPGELPGHRGCRGDFDHRVQPEPDQRRRGRGLPAVIAMTASMML